MNDKEGKNEGHLLRQIPCANVLVEVVFQPSSLPISLSVLSAKWGTDFDKITMRTVHG
jgi:hypothetical protein